MLAATSPEALIQTLIRLTHRIHVEDHRARVADARLYLDPEGHVIEAESLRVQRALVQAELLRRLT